MAVLWVLAPGALAAAVAARVPSLQRRAVVILPLTGVAPCASAPRPSRGSTPRAVVPVREEPWAALQGLLAREWDDRACVLPTGEAWWEGRWADPEGCVAAVEGWFRRVLHVGARAAVAPTATVARVAAHWPHGPRVVRDARQVASVPLSGLPWLPRAGVEAMAEAWAVFTVGELACVPAALVRKALGHEGVCLRAAVRGRAEPAWPGARVELVPPSNEPDAVRRTALEAADRAWEALAAGGHTAKRMRLRLVAGTMAPWERSWRFDPPAPDPLTVGKGVVRVLHGLRWRRAVHAVEVELEPGVPAGVELALFPSHAQVRSQRLATALLALRQRYGPGAVGRAATLR